MTIRSRLGFRTRLHFLLRRIRTPEPKPLVLMYHRIADVPIDHWGLAVSPGNFEEQLCVMRRTRHPLTLPKFVHNLIAGTLPKNAVAVTFDDGYVDNLAAGKPRLAAADMPATVFLATGYIDRAEGFWWDELARLVLFGNSPQSAEFVIRGTSHILSSTKAEFSEDADEAAGWRTAALSSLWNALRRLDDEERRLNMIKLRSIFAGDDDCSTVSRAMTGEEVRRLVADGLVTIGAHTVTHPVLAGLEPAACQREILESKRACETLIGAPITGFAYPYGNFDAQAREAVKIAGFSFACTTEHSSVRDTSDVFALPRIQVLNVDGDGFEQLLRLA